MKSKNNCIIPLLTLWFVVSPVISTEETANPGMVYILCMALPILFYGIQKSLLNLRPYHVSALIMFAMALISSALSNYSAADFPIYCKYLLFVLLYIVITNYQYNALELQWIAKCYIIIAVAVSILIILSFIGGYVHIDPDEVFTETQFLGRYSVGITGVYKNPNYLTSFANVAVFVLLYKLIYTKCSKKFLLFYISLVILFLISIVLTGTRMGLLTFFIVLFCLYGAKMISNFKIYYLFIPVITIVLIFIFFSEEINELVELYLGTRKMLSDDSREQAWGFAINKILDNFLLGCGSNSWDTLSVGTSYLPWLHNIFLELFLDQGLIGIILFLYTLFFGVNKINKVDKVFIVVLLLVTALPMFFQNGLIAVNFWRFMIINRIAVDYSSKSKEGITAIMKINN